MQAHRENATAGVLLVNLGTPDAPTVPAIRRYLRAFLSDRRVVELPRALWLPILYGFILPFRPRRLVHAYGKVWGPQGSPLLAHSLRQRAALEAELSERLGRAVPVELAMTYGNPGIPAALDALQRRGARRLLVFPLYPQYSATTTAAALDALFAALKPRRWLPELRTLGGYHDDPAYIDALAASLRAHWRQHGRGDHLLLSFHSIPQRCLALGDPYFCFCHKTARLLATAAGLGEDQWSVSFQSRIGKMRWLTPYTDAVVPQLAQRGMRTLDVICPGFAADCLETLEEVALRYRDAFIEAGGSALRYVPALNDSPVHVQALARIALREIAGWLPPLADAAELNARAQRAESMRRSLQHEALPPSA